MNFEKEKNHLTKEERDIINGYFEDPKTFKEIMALLDNLGITLENIDSDALQLIIHKLNIVGEIRKDINKS